LIYMGLVAAPKNIAIIHKIAAHWRAAPTFTSAHIMWIRL